MADLKPYEKKGGCDKCHNPIMMVPSADGTKWTPHELNGDFHNCPARNGGSTTTTTTTTNTKAFVPKPIPKPAQSQLVPIDDHDPSAGVTRAPAARVPRDKMVMFKILVHPNRLEICRLAKQYVNKYLSFGGKTFGTTWLRDEGMYHVAISYEIPMAAVVEMERLPPKPKPRPKEEEEYGDYDQDQDEVPIEPE